MNLDQLEKVARVATPGPWAWNYMDGDYSKLFGSDGAVVLDDGSAAGEYSPEIEPGSPNGQFVAAANPQTVLALIAVARAAGHVTAHEGVHLGEASVRWHALMNALAALEST